MLAVASGLLPPLALLMSLMLLGFLLGRAGVLTASFNQGLQFLLLKVTLPCLLVASMQRPFTTQWASLALSSWVTSLGLYAGLFVVSGLLLRMTRLEAGVRAIYQFVLMFSNVGFMGFPLMEALWGRDAVFLGALFNINFNLFVFSLGIWVLTRHRGPVPGALREVFLNPGFLATVAGLLLFLTSISLPPLMMTVVDGLGRLTTPLSMILIGSILAGSSMRAAWTSQGLWILASARLLAIPAVVWLVVSALGLPVEVSRLAVLIAGMPAAANTTLLAAEHQVHPGLASQAVLVTTTLSALTIPFVIVVLGLQ